MWDDVVGLSPSNPSFAKKYGNVRDVALDACRAFVEDVRGGTFPVHGEHSRNLNPREAVARRILVDDSCNETKSLPKYGDEQM